MNPVKCLLRLLRTIVLLAAAWAAAPAQAAVDIVIVNGNEPGIGFNDPTPVAPVGGNTGVTLGQQRLIAFAHAAQIWGGKLDSNVPVRVLATFEPLPCTANGAVLGAAGAWTVHAGFPGAPQSDTWYPAALASKLAGTDVAYPDQPHIIAFFNSRLGAAPDCLPGVPFYLGLDGQAGDGLDLVAVLLHEIAHGVGFQSYTDAASGEFFYGLPSIWDHFLTDNRLERQWVQMSADERAASAVSVDGLSWNGHLATVAVPSVLKAAPRFRVSGPEAGRANRNFEVGEAEFGPPLQAPALVAELMPVVDQDDGRGLACSPLSASNRLAVRNHVALVDGGGCSFVDKARNVQAAGGKGMVVVDNVPGPLAGMSGFDPAITVQSVRVTFDDGNEIRTQLQRRSRRLSGVEATLGIDTMRRAGADSQLRPRLFAPATLLPGSSVSHFTTEATPNLLMEPFLNRDLGHEVDSPRDLVLPLLKDIGW